MSRFAEQSVADRMSTVFERAGVQIKVIYMPPLRWKP